MRGPRTQWERQEALTSASAAVSSGETATCVSRKQDESESESASQVRQQQQMGSVFWGDFGGREWNEFVSRTQVEGERVNERRRGRSKIRSQLQPIKRATSGVGGSSSSSRTGEKQTCGSDSYARQSFKSLAEGVHAKRGRKRKDPKRGERREECDGD